MLDVQAENFTYPTGDTTTNFTALRHNPSITDIDVANPTFAAIAASPNYTYTVTQSAGFASRAGLLFNPSWIAGSALGAGSDVVNAIGISCSPKSNPTGDGTGRTINQNMAFFARPEIAGSAGTVSSLEGFRAQQVVATGTTATDMYGLRLIPPTTGGSITNYYGIYGADTAKPSGINAFIRQVGTNAHSRFNGNVTIGADSTPTTSAVLDLSTTTGALLVPRMTTTQKNALTAANGMIVYDTTLGKFQGYEAGAWTSFI